MLRTALRDPVTGCALALVALELALQSFRVRGWEEAGYRILIIATLAAGLLLLRGVRSDAAAARPRWRAALRAIVVLALLWDAALGVIAIRYTARTGDIRLDQGQSTYKGAVGLDHGENPYGRAALLDPYGYLSRLGTRKALGVGPQIAGGDAAAAAALWSYWATQDPLVRARLLPRAPPGASAAAVRETEMLGYKYGPLPMLVTAALAPMLGPLAVTAVNVVLVFALYFVCWRILRVWGFEPEFAALAFAAILIDHFPSWYYIHFSMSDAWPLLFCATSVYAVVARRPHLLGIALGLALASKLFPSLLFLPLLLLARSWRAAILMLLVASGLMLPFVIWDATGFANNYFLWSGFMLPDATSWIDRVPAGLALGVRVALAATVAFLWARLLAGRETRPFASFALMNMAVVAAGPVIHNNYVPWFSLWAAFAVAEAFSSARPRLHPGGANSADASADRHLYTPRP